MKTWSKVNKKFDELFVEFSADKSNWGAGLRIKNTGTVEDREILDGVKEFIKQALHAFSEATMPLPCVPKVKEDKEKWHIAGWNDYYITQKELQSKFFGGLKK